MTEYRVRLLMAWCLLPICILVGYQGWSEYHRIIQSPFPEPIRVERGVFRTADVILGGKINEQAAAIRLGSYGEFENFARKYNEHSVVVARAGSHGNEFVVIQYLLPSKRYYFMETIGHPWGRYDNLGRLTFEGSSIVLHARHDPAGVLIFYSFAAFSVFVLSLWFFPWRSSLSPSPATS